MDDIGRLRGYFGKEIIEFDGIAELEHVKPYIEKYIGQVYDRRIAIEK